MQVPNEPQILFGTATGDVAVFDIKKNIETSIILSPFVHLEQ